MGLHSQWDLFIKDTFRTSHFVLGRKSVFYYSYTVLSLALNLEMVKFTVGSVYKEHLQDQPFCPW